MTHTLPLYNQTFYAKEELTADLKSRLDPLALNNVLDAYEVASHVHAFQLRNDTGLYFHHISRVARILVQELRHFDSEVLTAALLHDVLEDSQIITRQVIAYNFGERVAHIVELLTKDLSLTGERREREEIRYLRELREGPVEAKIIKFAERLDNFRCLEFGLKRNPFQYIAETEQLYFPMAEETGDARLLQLVDAMKRIKGKLIA